MICPNCNSLIDDNSVMCPECGASTAQNGNDNFNNYFAQDGNFSSRYQNPQYSQQNNLNPPFPNGNQGYNQGYNQYPPNNYQYSYNAQPSDPGENSATTSQICGILSLFIGPILSIVSLVFASKYKKVGNGQNAGKVKAGKICSWISIIGTILSIIFFVFSFLAIVSDGADLLVNFGENFALEEWSDTYFDTNNEPIPEGEFGSSSDYDGIYEITGYVASSSYLNLYLDGVDNENSGSLDMTASSMKKYITDFKDYVYVKLTFKEGGLKDWSLIDISTSENIGKLTEEDLNVRFNPEGSYEFVSVGNMPEKILLSEYEVGKTYVFNINEFMNDNYYLPEIINDTNIPVLSVGIKTGKNDKFVKYLYASKTIGDSDVHNVSVGDNRLYLAITEASTDFLLKSEDCFYLSKSVIGEEIDFDFEDYIYNDTDKILTLSYEGAEYTLVPGEIAKCSWMNDVMVVNAE